MAIYVTNWGDNVTINGGAGNDTVTLTSSAKKNLISYEAGDGNDIIYGFKKTSTLSILGNSYSTTKIGADIIVTADDGKITLSGAASLSAATIKGVKSLDGLKLSGTTVTVSKASLNAKNVTVSDGYTLKLGSNVTKSTTKNAWSYSNSTATYQQTKSAGYTLEDNAISYSKKSTSTLATVKGAKSKSGLSVSGNVIKLKNSALTSKVTVSGGYEFDFASDYTKSSITGSNSNDIITARGKNISINGGKGNDTIKILGTGLVKGGAGADIINGSSGKDSLYGEAGNDKLYGGKGNDSLWGGAGNDTLYCDSGNDTFIYKPGEGTDTIFDYQSGDMLKILKSNGKEGGAFSSSSFKNGNLTLEISGGGSVVFDGVSKSSSFNINGDIYKISGNKLAARK